MMDRTEAVLEERLPFLFQTDVLTPARYLGTLRSTGLEPEKKLMLAVLEDAIRCFQGNALEQSDTRKRLFVEAEEWMLSESDDSAFSFENICDALGLNPEYVRQGLLRWKEKRLSRRRDFEAWEKIMNGPRKRTA